MSGISLAICVCCSAALAADQITCPESYTTARNAFDNREFARAETLYREALQTQDALPCRATTLNDLGMTLYVLGKLPEAESVLLQAIAGWEAWQGAESASRAISLENL